MGKFIKKYWWVGIVFLSSFICLYLLGFSHNYGDPINNYAFSYAITRGEVPYLDFNIISTPLYAFVMTPFLFLANNYITFLLEQSLLVTIAFVLLYKLFGLKSLLLLFPTVITRYANIIGTYNFMCFLIMILIIYMEQKHKNKDYLIGALIALAIFSKQTVGIFFIIPSIIFYHKDLKKLQKRFIGFLIPCFIFLIYFLINKCLGEFLDICLFGLFDFFNNNGIGSKNVYLKYFILSLVAVFLIGFMLFKHKKDINLYYLICGFFFAFPLFDSAHFAMFFNCLVIAFMPYIKISDKIIKRFSIIFFIISSVILYNAYSSIGLDLVFTKKLKHFEYFIHDKKEYELTLGMDNFIDKYKDNKMVILGYFAIKYKIYNDLDITSFDILNQGNYGYNGSNKMIDKIKKMHNCYFIVSLKDLNNDFKMFQFDKKIANYVIDNYKKIDESKKYNLAVYYKD